MSAPSLNIDSQIETEMMKMGSGVLTDLDRFVLGSNSDCDIDGRTLNATDYFGGYYGDDEPRY